MIFSRICKSSFKLWISSRSSLCSNPPHSYDGDDNSAKPQQDIAPQVEVETEVSGPPVIVGDSTGPTSINNEPPQDEPMYGDDRSGDDATVSASNLKQEVPYAQNDGSAEEEARPIGIKEDG